MVNTYRARYARQADKLDRTEQLLREALEVVPNSHLAQVQWARHFLAIGEKQRAINTANQHKACFRVPHLSEAPVIDGDPTDPVWDETLSSELRYLKEVQFAYCLAKDKSSLAIGYRDGHIYMKAIGYEADLSKMRITKPMRDIAVFEDDCVELFFDPEESGTTGYQSIANPLGTQYDYVTGDPETDIL